MQLRRRGNFSQSRKTWTENFYTAEQREFFLQPLLQQTDFVYLQREKDNKTGKTELRGRDSRIDRFLE